MDRVGASSEMNWSALNGTVSADETEFLSQLLGSYPFTDDPDSDLSFELPATFWSGHEAINMVTCGNDSYHHCLHALDSSFSCLPQGNNGSLCIPSSDYENHYIGDANIIPAIDSSTSAMDHCMVDERKKGSLLGIVPDNLYEETAYLNEEMNADDLGEPSVYPAEQVLLNQKMLRKRKSRVSKPDKVIEEKADSSQAAKKRTRVKGDVQRNANSTHSTKIQKVNWTTHEEESSAALNGKSSSGNYSEDNSIGSQEMSGGMSSNSKGTPPLNSNRTTRASRGSATDPQSLYARKRRERINQRLRILQNLVPNGTKVDISTMLEEAVQYVKFLQLQIKLLSSDDLWMYAPIAYNGKDIGLDLMISAP